MNGFGKGVSVVLRDDVMEGRYLEAWAMRFAPRGTNFPKRPNLEIAQQLRPVLSDIIETHLR